MQSDLLAIAIPTYNRPAILSENIRAMLPEIQKLGIPVYISDDSPNHDTENAVSELRQTYDYIYYTRNAPGLGHDLNFVATIQLPRSEYVWYLGDSVLVNKGDVEKAFAILTELRPDFLFVNNENRCADTGNYSVTNVRDFLRRFAWHLTLSGATIYSKAAVQSLHAPNVKQWRNFPQLGLIFQYALSGNRSLYWAGSSGVSTNRNKLSYWKSSVVTTFAVDWVNLVKNFASFYSAQELQEMIVAHSFYEKTFSWRNVIKYRINGAFSFDLLRKHRVELKQASHTSFVILVLISLLPLAACRWIVGCVKHIKNLRA